MSPELMGRVRAVFDAVSELSREERERALGAAEPEVRAQVESLLASHDAAGEFLSKPAVGLMSADGEDPFVGFTLGGYRVTGLLGTGGMGAVYSAEQGQPRRTVALKVIRAGWLTPALRRRFAHEAEALGRLRHPGIAQIFEAGSAPGPDGRETPFFAMELVRGVSLTEYVKGHGLGVRERLALFAMVCDAAHHAHQKGIVHRDLKPGNILVEEEGREEEGAKEGRNQEAKDWTGSSTSFLRSSYSSFLPGGVGPKILDFGIARLTDSDAAVTTMQTDQGQIVGTLAYMSPEQVRGEVDRIDTRSDVYALGVVLFELLTGRLPYALKGKAVPEAARVIADEEPTLPGSVERGLRGDLETIILKAIAKEPERRYQSAAELGADVRRYLSHLPIVARPATTAYQLRKFARRNRALVVGVCAAFVLLVAGIIGTSIGMVQARQAEARAVAAATRAGRANSYLRGTMGWFKPGSARSPTVTLKDVLDAAAARIDKELADQPDVASFMHATVARNYLSVGDLDKAWEHAEAAARWAGSEDSDEMIEAIELKISVLSARGKFAEAVPMARAMLEMRVRTRPEHDALVAKAGVQLGALLKNMRELDEAERVLSAALEDLRASGMEVASRVEGASELAMLVRRRDPKRAIVLMTEANDLARSVPDFTEEERAILSNNLATAVKDDGDFDQAEKLYLESLELRRKIYGEDHASVALVVNNLGTIYQMRGEAARAEETYSKALEMRRRLLGPEHRQTINTMENLARVAEERGDNAQSERLFAEALAVRKKIDGPDKAETALTAACHAGMLIKLGRLDEGEPELRTALKVMEGTLGNKSPETQAVRSRLANLLSMRGLHPESMAMYQELANWYDRNAPGRWSDGCAMHMNLARELRQTGRPEEARKEAARAVEIMSGRVSASSPNLAAARVTLAGALNDLQRFAEGEAAAREAYAALGSDPKVSATSRAGAAVAIADAVLGLGRAAEAEAVLVQALAELAAKQESGAALTGVRGRLAKVYEKLGRPEEAAKYADPPDGSPGNPAGA